MKPSPWSSPGTYWRERALDTARSWRSSLSTRTLALDWIAGVSVACVALPLNLALAIASGLPAAVGLITAVAAGLVATLLGGSTLQITGPEAALVPLVWAIVQAHGVAGLIVATLICGAVQIALGLVGAGRVARRAPPAVVRGFMAGIGLLLLSTQVPRWWGLPEHIRSVSALWEDLDHWAHMKHWDVVAGACVIAAMLLLPRVHRLAPAALVGLVGTTILATALALPMPLVGPLEVDLGALGMPDLSGVDVVALLPLALPLALVASMGSLLSAMATDALQDRAPRADLDQELVGQGFANLAAGLVGGMPVMGAIVRSSVGVAAGARTRMTPWAHALVIGAATVWAAPLVARVPIAALAAILVVIGVRLLGWGELRRAWGDNRSQAFVHAGTAIAIVATDMLRGIAIGLVLAAADAVRRDPALLGRMRARLLARGPVAAQELEGRRALEGRAAGATVERKPIVAREEEVSA